MDIITHFLVPYIILTILKSKNKLAGAFGGISLDFDFLIVWIGILFPEYFIFSHRGITHSFILGFITSLIFIYILSRKPVKRSIGYVIKRDINLEFNKSNAMTVGFIACFGALTHLVLDFLTSKGIPLLYPFTITRYSAEIYYYLDSITLAVGAVVLFIIYLKINWKYKKVAMAVFIVLLVSFGGIRGYEKFTILQTESVSFNGNYTEISAYPTSDMFVWNVVGTDFKNQQYHALEYNAIENRRQDIGTFKFITVQNGSYESAKNTIKIADNLPEVENFRWDAYFTCIDATSNSPQWNITYYDFLGSTWHMNNLTVIVP
ncbi:MAG: metal-dependent hydrolase [Euryarchaeota archaeon]|nr:metal-dependent hydrolase [Euryarchaeota archaeon]